MRVKFNGSTKDVPLLEVTAENYIVPVGEENTYHCRIEQVQFSPTNGKRLSKPRIQKFDAKMYPSIARNLRQQGYSIDVLYDPTDYNAEVEAKRTQMLQMSAQQKRAELKASLKAEIMAELKEAGLLKAPKTQKAPKTDGATK